jgi:putative ABC transport system permease protein
MFKLAIKNILRNKKRTILSGLTIFIATIAVLAFLALENGMFESMETNAINQISGNINIQSKLYEENNRVLPLQFYIPKTDAMISKIEKVDGVTSVSRKTTVPVSIWIDEESETAIANSVDFDNSNFFGSDRIDYFEGEMPKANSKDVLITTRLANLLNLGIGDKFTFLSKTATGGSNALTVKTVGIIGFKNSDLNNYGFYIAPTTMSSMLRMDDGAIELFVYTNEKVKAKDIANILNDDTLIIRDWKDVSVIGIFISLSGVIYGYMQVIFYILASTVIINSTMMSVLERRREAATMIAIGYSEKWVRNLFLLESAIISLSAALLGAILGAIILTAVGNTGINFGALGGDAVKGFGFNSYIYLSLPLTYYFTSVLYATVIAIVACIFPTRKILKLEPAVALHDEM